MGIFKRKEPPDKILKDQKTTEKILMAALLSRDELLAFDSYELSKFAYFLAFNAYQIKNGQLTHNIQKKLEIAFAADHADTIEKRDGFSADLRRTNPQHFWELAREDFEDSYFAYVNSWMQTGKHKKPAEELAICFSNRVILDGTDISEEIRKKIIMILESMLGKKLQ